MKLWGFAPVFKWLAGLKLESFYDDITARGLTKLSDLDSLTEIDLVELGMSSEQALPGLARYSRYLVFLPAGSCD